MIEIVLAVMGQCYVASWINEYSAQMHCKFKNVHLTYAAEDQPITPHSCMLYGQGEITKWFEYNPNWVVQRWSCGRPKTVAKA